MRCFKRFYTECIRKKVAWPQGQPIERRHLKVCPRYAEPRDEGPGIQEGIFWGSGLPKAYFSPAEDWKIHFGEMVKENSKERRKR
jgi:hypothetical protein